jgi:hypothetical protein
LEADPPNYRIVSDVGPPPTAIIVVHFGTSVLEEEEFASALIGVQWHLGLD